MTVQYLDAAIRAWHVCDGDPPPAPVAQLRSYSVIVAIGGRGDYGPALQLAAREAKHSGLAVKLVHGSLDSVGLSCDAHQVAELTRRGRGIVDAAASALSELVENVEIDTCIVPMTGVDALLCESLTAPLIVLQRTPTTPGTRDTPGSTMSVVAAHASCPVALAPSGHAGRVSTGVLMRIDNRDVGALARSPEWVEAALRRVPLTIEHASDGPLSHRLTSAHLAPSQKGVGGGRAHDLRRLAQMVTALAAAAETNEVLPG